MREWLDELEDRTRQFGVDAIDLSEDLERVRIPNSVIWQFIDAGTSVAANHRACRRARSDRELLAKLAVVDEEIDESVLWLELMRRSRRGAGIAGQIDRLRAEAIELRSIFASSRATMRQRVANSGA